MYGLLLLAHGARDPAWVRPFEAVAQRIGKSAPDLPLQLAFLEFMHPDLVQGIVALGARGCRQIHVVPLFLGTGGHVRRDVPRLLDAARAQLPGVEIRLHPAVGDHPVVTEALAQASLGFLAQTDPSPGHRGSKTVE